MAKMVFESWLKLGVRTLVVGGADARGGRRNWSGGADARGFEVRAPGVLRDGRKNWGKSKIP